MKKLLIGLAIAGLMVSCRVFQKKQNKTMIQKTASGLQYQIIKEGKGGQPKNGDLVLVHYVGKLTNDTVFDSSRERNQPISFKLGDGQVIKGWDEGIALLHKGDKAIFTIPAELGYGAQAVGTIPANSTLIFEVELIDYRAGAVPYETAGKDTITTASGLKYIVVKTGNGVKAESGNRVTAHYTGYFTDGKIFDSSVERGEPFKFEIGKNKVIKGWDEGLALMDIGSKYRFIVPPDLAYGSVDRGPIPANSTLIFDVELINAEKSLASVPYDVQGKDTLTTQSGLQYIVVKEGKGAKPKSGNTVKVHYTGYLIDGNIFDSSIPRDEPFQFNLGIGQVIKGWDEGVALMNKGAKYRLIIPYKLGYGPMGYGPIPAKATLIFDVELLDFF